MQTTHRLKIVLPVITSNESLSQKIYNTFYIIAQLLTGVGGMKVLLSMISVIASNDVPSLQIRSVGSHSKSGR